MTVQQRLARWRKRRHNADDGVARATRKIKTRLARLAQRPALAAYLAREFDLRFTSGWRSVAHNKAVGGVPGSWHTKGTRLNPKGQDLVGAEANMQDARVWAEENVPRLDEALVHDAGSGRHLHLGGDGVGEWRMPKRKLLGRWRANRETYRKQRRTAQDAIDALKESQDRKVSAKGIRLVAEFEGGQGKDGRFHPYQDPVGVWTQGYGHTKGVDPGDAPWSKAKAEAVLRSDLNSVYAPHVRRLGLPLNQNQFDALVSFIFNLGPGSIDASTGIGKALRDRDWKRAGDQMLRWNKAGGKVLPGLTRRREAERRLFLSDG